MKISLKSQWISLFYRAATGTKSIRTLLTPLGAGFFILFIVVLVLVSIHLDRWMGLPKLLPRPWHLLFSMPPAGIGFFMVGWSVQHFIKAKGTPVPFNPPPRLVQSGPYAFTRNPMLTGVFFLLFSLGFCMASISMVFFFTPLFIGINFWELKSIEEPELEKRLGETYRIYKRKTPMFIPRLRGRAD
jgi:protein-S-isoprenylcysteine O-methyltransferase Ste14